jgi:hypothetical protein
VLWIASRDCPAAAPKAIGSAHSKGIERLGKTVRCIA